MKDIKEIELFDFEIQCQWQVRKRQVSLMAPTFQLGDWMDGSAVEWNRKY